MTSQKPNRTPEQVAQNHITAVLTGDTKQMAADYSKDAILERGGDIYTGIKEIQAYFQTVPSRLSNAQIYFDKLLIDGTQATFFWRIVGENIEASGTDLLTIQNGEITHQSVKLNSSDF